METTIVRYRVLDQRRYDIVCVEDMRHKRQSLMSVAALVRDQEMLTEFNTQDACLIGYIAGQLESQNPLTAPQTETERRRQQVTENYLDKLVLRVKN